MTTTDNNPGKSNAPAIGRFASILMLACTWPHRSRGGRVCPYPCGHDYDYAHEHEHSASLKLHRAGKHEDFVVASGAKQSFWRKQFVCSAGNVFSVVLVFLLLQVGLSSAVLAQPHSKNHQKLAEEAGCFVCHYMPPETASGSHTATKPQVDRRLKRGAGQWCVSCHSMEAMTLHPTGIKVGADTDLPLEDGEYMSCLTCHSPHAAALASQPWAPLAISPAIKDNFSTFLLNHPNSEGQLCAKCHAPGTEVFSGSLHSPKAFDNRNFAGSESCKTCHLDIYDQWKLTPHARMTRRFRHIDNQGEIPVEELGVPREKIAWVLGSHYVHRFVAEASGTLVVLPKIWDVREKKWLPVNDYGWRSRYWLKQCAGCHTTGFSAENDSFAEAGVGCEACHGPGVNHVRTGSPEYIMSIKKLPADRQEMICISCHTSGIDNSGQYHFPVGYRPGDDLTKFFSGLTPKPGQSFENFTGDESYEDRRRQWEFLQSRLFLASGLTCDYCQNFRNVKTADSAHFLTHNQYCLTCHTDKLDHPEESPGTNCNVCHQPTRHLNGNLSVHDHRYKFEK